MFCRILSRLGIERDVILFGVYSHNNISQNKTEYFILSKVAEVSTFINLIAWWQNLYCALEKGSVVKLCYHVEIIFMSLFACGRRHYVVGLSVRRSVRILTHIYSGSGRGWGIKANLIFVCQGGRRGSKQIYTKK